jgi:AcrR family transcriptional regulator
MDVEERRRTVSEAACRVLVRDGLTALTVRKVAAEAGLPPSSLRYTFPTQASVREHAIDLVFDRTSERIEAISGDGRQWAWDVLLETLPLDEERRVELEVYLALGTAALTDQALRPAHERVVGLIRDWCGRVLEALGVPAAVREVETARLHALIDGLALQLVRLDADGDGDPAWAIAVLERHVDEITP